MKHFPASYEPAVQPDRVRAPWPLADPTLAYFPNARFASARDLGAGPMRSSRLRCVATRLGGAVVEGAAPNSHGHVPVLLDRCIEVLAPALTRHHADGSGALMVDATLGAGGHSEAFLTRFPGLQLIGLDRDRTALDIAGARLAPFGDRARLIHTRYDGIDDALSASGYPTTDVVDAVLMDLGVSSMQLDRADRGFSYSADAPLDMRMDQDNPLTAAEILNTYHRDEIARILRDYGEERYAGRIAGFVVRQREQHPLGTTAELVELLYAAIPAATRRTGGHPAKRTFQALRVAVNGELDSLRAALPLVLSALTVGGRAAVMSYQSLEDRMVKGVFAAATASRTPAGLPMELPGYEPEFVALTRGAERADAVEIERNSRSAAVRLRAVERVTERAGA